LTLTQTGAGRGLMPLGAVYGRLALFIAEHLVIVEPQGG
jgi:hypothetical protein